MRIALVGTRGVPARYGGFETAIEEIGQRLVAQGHDVTVYCRPSVDTMDEYLGMKRVVLPVIKHKYFETVLHTAISLLHLMTRLRKPDAVIVFNAANAFVLPLLRLRRIPVATHVDGLEWKRDKWSGLGKAYYRISESLSVRWSDRLIADAQGIADYYTEEFGVATDIITYGAPILRDMPTNKIESLGLTPKNYHVVVARFEPENHVDIIVEGYAKSKSTLPLVVVGSAPYASDYTARISALAEGDDRVRLLGGIWDSEQLDQLYTHSLTYVHGHSVGGTNPSLLRAMGSGTATVAYDVTFNREVLGGHGLFFSSADDIARTLPETESRVEDMLLLGKKAQERAESVYDWNLVTADYEKLCVNLANRRSQRGTASGKRRGSELGLVGARN